MVVVVGQVRDPPAAPSMALRPPGSLPWSWVCSPGEMAVAGVSEAADPAASAVACSLAQMPASPLRATLTGLLGDDAGEAVKARAPITVKTSITMRLISLRIRRERTDPMSAHPGRA